MIDRLVRPSFHCLRGTVLIGTLWLMPAAIVPAQQTDETFLKALDAISGERMFADMARLSSAEFNGRQAGTDDDLRSAVWVRDQFSSAGLSLTAASGSLSSGGETVDRPNGLMTTTVSAPAIDADPKLSLSIGSSNRAVIKTLGSDYLPILDAPSAEIQGRIVFVGYGIVDPAQGLDDYADVDVTNCIVLFLRGKPEHSSKHVSHAEKVRLARARGALAYLTATGPMLTAYEARRGVTGAPSAFYAQMPMAEALPGAWISTRLAEEILDGSHENSPGRLHILQNLLNKGSGSKSVPTDRSGSLIWKTRVQEGLLANVAAFFPGTGSDAIVVGAHRDHFGRQAGLVFPGADDNASGTAVILEVGRALAKAGFHPKRTIFFVSFSGEEKDLLGSRWYVSHPAVPLSSTTAMINIDHAGIGNGRLTVGITGLDKRVAQDAGQSAGLAEKLDLFGFFPGGDHVPFHEAGIPTVTIVSGGIHPHFHQPTDTADTINPEILKTAAKYVLALVWQLGIGVMQD